MPVGRRGFLGALLATATLDPERLLWRAGAKVISIPKRRARRPYAVFESPEMTEYFNSLPVWNMDTKSAEASVYTCRPEIFEMVSSAIREMEDRIKSKRQYA